MRPAGRSASVLLRVLGGLHLLLLLWPPATRGQIIDGMSFAMCSSPPDRDFAVLSEPYRNETVFAVGTTVEYECRPGYRKVSDERQIACRPMIGWTRLSEFCTKMSCPNPAPLVNGDIQIPANRLFGEVMVFSCHAGHALFGEETARCIVVGDNVEWSNENPTCTEIFCPEPPRIKHGRVSTGREERYVYNHIVRYSCDEGYSLVGEDYIQCSLIKNEGVWSFPGPTCEGYEATENNFPLFRRSGTHSDPSTLIVGIVAGVVIIGSIGVGVGLWKFMGARPRP
ncbi:complement decay-accelerating factor-like isoform X1 [Microcebus murinus]|uniref:complement decay-accelerating factor-like isoform X1 n=1 Tax=Microcebus murinus TaxID=30608 RepID=UPI003F6C418F